MGSFYIMYVSLIYTHTNTYVPMHIYVYIYIYIYIHVYSAVGACIRGVGGGAAA
jgi:hypothetical protein